MLSLNDTDANLNFTFPSGLQIEASLSARVPWDRECPETCGPEGWASNLPAALLPTHYFVQTVASRAEYRLNGVWGVGFAHQEANYGGFFPDAWTWVQGMTADGNSQLVLTGGSFTIAGITTKQFILAYRSSKFHWDFRSIDADHFSTTVDACGNTLKLQVKSPLGNRQLELEVSAPVGTYSEPLYFPTPTGWKNTPGSVESYRAVAVIKLFKRQGFGKQTLLEQQVIVQTALEFGGSYRCEHGSASHIGPVTEGSVLV